MKKIVSLLLVATALIGNTSASHDTKKTELLLRDHRYRPMAFTTFHALNPNQEKDFASKFQITGFYNETQDASDLGEVFGANCCNKIVVGTEAQVTAGTADVENNFLLHYSQFFADNTLEGTIKFNPKRTTYGTHFEVFVSLDKIIKGLYFKENMVFTYVKHDLGVQFCNSKPGAEQKAGDPGAANESHTLRDILRGKNLKRTVGGGDPKATGNILNEQEALRYAKICGAHSRTGLQDIEAILGWRFINKKDYVFGVSIALHSPTGDRPTGEFLWEPRLGSQHWALGAGLEAAVTLWENNSQILKLFYEGHYRYLFDDTEKRTLGIKNVLKAAKYSKHILSHYYLLGEDKKYLLHPAANILTRDVEVEPGSQIDTFIALAYKCGSFTFDLGYNLYWKEGENVCLNRCNWTDNKYAIAAFNFSTCSAGDPFDVTGDDDAQPVDTPINFCNIDTSVAETPSMLSHSIFGGIGYIFKNWEYPLMLGLGGAYEFGDDRAAADSFTVWGKLGFSF